MHAIQHPLRLLTRAHELCDESVFTPYPGQNQQGSVDCYAQNGCDQLILHFFQSYIKFVWKEIGQPKLSGKRQLNLLPNKVLHTQSPFSSLLAPAWPVLLACAFLQMQPGEGFA
jgi:hypothetical protein